MTAPEVPIEQDLLNCVSRGEMTEWQAMQAQTCRDAAYARATAEALQKKMDELDKDPVPEKKTQCPVNLVSRGS